MCCLFKFKIIVMMVTSIPGGLVLLRSLAQAPVEPVSPGYVLLVYRTIIIQNKCAWRRNGVKGCGRRGNIPERGSREKWIARKNQRAQNRDVMSPRLVSSATRGREAIIAAANNVSLLLQRGKSSQDHTPDTPVSFAQKCQDDTLI